MPDPKTAYLGVFLREWELYRKKAAEEAVGEGDSAVMEVPFDADVKAGEVRVFADGVRPLVGLVLVRQSSADWLVVPVSEFTVPASEREILIGRRVYQLWNAFTESVDFVARSWIAETVPAEDIRDVAAAMAQVLAGDALPDDLEVLTGLPIVRTDDPRLDYEREFASRSELRLVEPERRTESRPYFQRRGLLGMAACFMIICGMVAVILRDDDVARPSFCREEPPLVVEPFATDESVPEPPPALETVIATEPMTTKGPALEGPPAVDESIELAQPVAGPVDVEPPAEKAVVKTPVVSRPKERRWVRKYERAVQIASARNDDMLKCAAADIEECSTDCDFADDAEVFTMSAKKSRSSAETDVCNSSRHMGVVSAHSEFDRSVSDSLLPPARYPASVVGSFRRAAVVPWSMVGFVVDTSSYEAVRRSLLAGRLPAKDAVRLEEMVNHFRFAYPVPTNDAPVAVDCELAACPWNSRHQLLRVGIQAKNPSATNAFEGVGADGAKLQLRFNPGRVGSYRLLGYDNRTARGYGGTAKETSDIAAGYRMTAFYELVPRVTEKEMRPELLTVKFMYRKPDSETEKCLEMQFAASAITRKEGPSEDFRFASAVAEFALLLRDPGSAGDAPFASLVARAKSAKGEDRDGLRAEFIRLAETAASILRSGGGRGGFLFMDDDDDSDF